MNIACRSKELVDHLGDDMVDIYVGLEERKWTLHKSLICHRAPYFAAAFEGAFSESKEKCIHLKEDHPAGFEIFVYWLYRDCLPELYTYQDHQSSSDLMPRSLDNSIISVFVSFYIQADKFLLPPSTKVQVLDAISTMRKMDGTFKNLLILPVSINHVFENIPEEDPLRTMILDLTCCDYATSKEFRALLKEEAEREDSTFNFFKFLEAFQERNNIGKDNKNHFFDPLELLWEKDVKQISRYKTGFLKP